MKIRKATAKIVAEMVSGRLKGISVAEGLGAEFWAADCCGVARWDWRRSVRARKKPRVRPIVPERPS
jgi:hypothetical protein